MPVSLDNNERAYLTAYANENPDFWVMPAALTARAEAHGADPIACTAAGAISTARRLCQRKLLEGNDERGQWRGYSITDKGKAALG